jgi:hypothetical protein
MLEFNIIVPENYILPLENFFIYVPGSATAVIYVSGQLTKNIFINY